MKSISGNAAQRRPNPPTRRPSEEIPTSAVFGFLVSESQFRVLQSTEPAVSTNRVQRKERLIDLRSTRLSRLQSANRTDDQETLLNRGIFNTVAILNDEQGIVSGGDCVEPVSYEHHPTFFSHSLSAYTSDILKLQSGGNVNYELETGVVNDALYGSNVKEVACTIEKCNKRISCAGPEWSVGRPGNRPIGARDAARNTEMCLGPYATRAIVHPHTGHNTRGEDQASPRQPRPKDQDNTSQPRASPSRRPTTAEDRASLAIAAASMQAALLLWRSRRGCPRMNVHCQLLARYRSGRALKIFDIRCVTIERSSL